jgi:hypothetical protein
MAYSYKFCCCVIILILLLAFVVYGIVGLFCTARDESFLLPFYNRDTLLLELSGYNYGIDSPSTTDTVWFRITPNGAGIALMPAQYFADTQNLKSWYIFNKDQITDICSGSQDSTLRLKTGTDIMPVVRDMISNKQLVVRRQANEVGWWTVELDC